MLADLAKADVVFVGEQHDDPEHAPPRAGHPRRAAPPRRAGDALARDVRARRAGRASTAISPARHRRRGIPQGVAAVAALRDRLPPARRDGQGAGLAGRRRRTCRGGSPRASPRRAWRRSTRSRRRSARGSPPSCSVRSDAYFERFAPATMAAGPPTVPRTGDGQADEAEEDQRSDDRTLLFLAVREGRDDGRGDCRRRSSATAASSSSTSTGAFHSDFGQGTAERVRRRLPGRRVAVVSVLPVKDLDTLAPAGEDSSAPTISSTRRRRERRSSSGSLQPRPACRRPRRP